MGEEVEGWGESLLPLFPFSPKPFFIDAPSPREGPGALLLNGRSGILFKDLMDYKEAMDRLRLKALDELVEQAQKPGLGY